MRNIVMCLMLCFLGLAFVLLARADTFKSTWKSPDAGPLHFAGKKVAAIVLAKTPTGRATAEDLLAKKITERGAVGVTGNSLLSPSDLEDKEKAKAKLLAAGISGAVVLRPVLEGGVEVGPEAWANPQYRKFMGYPGSQSEKDQKVPFYVEVTLYSLEKDQLIWAGRTSTKAIDVDNLITKITDGVVEALQKDGLLGK